MQSLYTYSFSGVVTKDIEGIVEKLTQIDELIGKVATDHGIAGMNKVDLAILRLAVFELLEGTKLNIVIDEAIEIAKSFGSDASSKFVNATLSKIAENL